MIRTVLLTIMVSLFALGSVYAEKFDARFYSNIDPQIRAIINDVYEENFESALNRCGQLADQYPEHPVGYFFRTCVYDTLIRDYYDYRYYPSFDNAVNAAITKAEALVEITTKNHTPDVWAHFYLGGALGYRGLHRFQKNEWIQAFSDGIAGVKQLDACLDINPQMYDAYYGLGCFYYWKSAKSRVLWFLPFIRDERAKGIKYLHIAIDNGNYTFMEAQFALLKVLNNEQKYEQVIKQADKLISVHQQDIYSRTQKAFAYEGLEQWDDAAHIYGKMLCVLAASNLHTFNRMCEIAHYEAHCYDKAGKPSEIERIYQYIQQEKEARDVQENITPEALDHICKIKELLK